MRLLVDIETNRLHKPDKIWCIVAKDIDTQSLYIAKEDEVYGNSIADALRKATTLIGHNALSFDVVHLNSLLGLGLDPRIVTDTLVLSHLLDYRMEGGHSLEAWGERLKYPKGKFNDFDKYSAEMLEYCINDVHLNHKVYDYLMQPKKLGHPTFKRAIECEMEIARICQGMHEDGFSFDRDKAETLLSELNREVGQLDQELLHAFPPRAKVVKEYNPRLTKQGTISKASVPRDWVDLTTVAVNSPFTLVTWEPFNPGSPKQIVERLNAAGWKPVDKTKGHIEAEKSRGDLSAFRTTGWKVNERNLATLPESAPAASRKLVERIMLGARVRSLVEWLACYNNDTGCVHSRLNGIGTWTHRMSSTNPNIQNIAAEKSIKYNGESLKARATQLGGQMRALWKVRDQENWMVGADMDAAHLRIFGHLIDDKQFIEALCKGRKEDGTDIHTLNKQKLGSVCVDRDRSKTFIYTFLNGGGAGKIAEIFGCSVRQAKEGLDLFVKNYPGLARLKRDKITAWSEQGYFIGLDGRAVKCESEHHMLAGMLQNYEKVLMSYANIRWRQAADSLGLHYIQLVTNHDEWQTEVVGDKHTADVLGQLQVDALVKTGEEFGLSCPIAGDFRVGKNWLDTH